MVGVPPKAVTPTQPTINTPISVSGTKSLTVGDALDLSVAPALSSGTGSFTYQWKKGGANVANGAGTTGATSANLKIASVATTDAGTYTCIVSESTASNSPQTSANAVVTVAAAVIPPTVTSVSITAPVAGTQKIGATGTGAVTVVVAGTTPPAKTVTWSSAKAASISVVAGTGAWKVENAAVVGEKVILTATSTVDATKKDTVELTVGAPDLTGFTLADTTVTGATFDFAAKTLIFDTLAASSAAGIVLTPTAVPAKAVLGALTVANADDTKAKAEVAPAGKFTIKPVAVDTTGTTVTLKVAGAPDYILTVTTLA